MKVDANTKNKIQKHNHQSAADQPLIFSSQKEPSAARCPFMPGAFLFTWRPTGWSNSGPLNCGCEFIRNSARRGWVVRPGPRSPTPGFGQITSDEWSTARSLLIRWAPYFPKFSKIFCITIGFNWRPARPWVPRWAWVCTSSALRVHHCAKPSGPRPLCVLLGDRGGDHSLPTRDQGEGCRAGARPRPERVPARRDHVSEGLSTAQKEQPCHCSTDGKVGSRK